MEGEFPVHRTVSSGLVEHQHRRQQPFGGGQQQISYQAPPSTFEHNAGFFSEESIRAVDSSGVPWLFITSKNERYLQEIRATLQETSQTVEMVMVPGTQHATRILEAHPTMAERIAVWLAQRLR